MQGLGGAHVHAKANGREEQGMGCRVLGMGMGMQRLSTRAEGSPVDDGIR